MAFSPKFNFQDKIANCYKYCNIFGKECFKQNTMKCANNVFSKGDIVFGYESIYIIKIDWILNTYDKLDGQTSP